MADEQHKADFDRVEGQNSLTDIVRGVEDRPQAGFFNRMVHSAFESSPIGRTVAQRTDFDKHDLDLNQLIDLVEQTDPEDLESSGKALWDARDAIKAAADELNGHIDNVHWVGESGDAFRTWGGTLVTNTQYLSDFAGSAGDQITAAAVGLASVRGAMPSRDTDPSRKRPDTFTEAEKAANKEDYAAAVKVEKDRQEAINQMNRLASYYAVSEEVLAALPSKDKTPEFTAMPDVGVPTPARRFDDGSSGSTTRSYAGTETASVGGHHMAATEDVARHSPTDDPTPTRDITGRIAHPDEPVRTNIDSVGTLPTSPAGHTLPVTSAPPLSGGQTSAFEGGLGTPLPNGMSGRNLSGSGGFRTPASAQGRPTNQMGRATSTGGQPGARGTAPGSKSLPMGRGVTGGTPRAAGGPAPRANVGPTTGAGRSNGVVGGRPTSPGGTSAKNGTRIPRGTVVGSEGAANSRPVAGRPGQRGVFGAPESATRPGAGAPPSRIRSGTPEGVTGSPAARNSVAGAERNGMTRGGAGLARGTGNSGKPGDERNAQEPPRPDHLVEDEETYLPNRPRRDVPPAVN